MPDNPQLPAVTFETTVGEQVESFTGYSGLSNPVMTFHAWATTAGVARDLSNRLRDALVGQSWAYGGVSVDNVLGWSSVDLYDEGTELFHVSASCRIWYY